MYSVVNIFYYSFYLHTIYFFSVVFAAFFFFNLSQAKPNQWISPWLGTYLCIYSTFLLIKINFHLLKSVFMTCTHNQNPQHNPQHNSCIMIIITRLLPAQHRLLSRLYFACSTQATAIAKSLSLFYGINQEQNQEWTIEWCFSFGGGFISTKKFTCVNNLKANM